MALLSGQLNAQIWHERQANSANDRALAISKSWDYYEGRHPQPLAVKPNVPDDNVIVNLARPVVDKGISLLFGKAVTWQIDESATQTSGAEQFLDDVWTANKKMALLHEVAQNGALAGLCAIKIDPRPHDTQRPYRLINLDPSNLEIFTADEDIDDVWRYRTEYTTCDSAGNPLHTRQDITRDGAQWIIDDYVCQGADVEKTWMGGTAWKRVGAPVIWAYALPPIVHCKNLPCANSVWGYGDLEDVRLNDALNLIASSTRKILRLHASPQTVARNFNPALLRRDANMIWEIPEGTDGELFNLVMQSDLEASRKFYLELRSAFYAQGRMPDVAHVGNLGALTNFGLRVLFADALERTATKQMMYGDLITQINRTLCLIAGHGDNVTTKLTWPDPLPVNKQENVATVQAELATGLTSNETLAGDLGRDYTDELARLADEKKARQAAAPGAGVTGPRVAVADVLPGSSPDGTADPIAALKLAQGAKQT
ncbi:MAG: phage portal protein [Chloroflexota bacterium]|nr:phage portal protein [Chloroflexota bacterium]